MKSQNTFNIIITLLLINSTMAYSQVSDDSWDLMLIREDKVYPSMTEDYEMTLMDLKEFLGEKKVKQFNYFAHMQADYFFTHVTPLHHLKDISKGIHSMVAKEVKDPELDLILDYLSESIESYRYYIVQYHPELSYIPDGDDWAEGSPYRRWSYYYCQPGTEDEVEEVLGAYNQLYKKMGLKMGYRVFKGFIGIEQPLYMLTTWGEDPMSYQQNLQKASEVLGEEGAALWSKMMSYTHEAKSIEGWFLPQYSYTGGLKLAE